MTIRFLSKIEKWKDFSNLSPHPIEIGGEIWNSVEHYYQFKKFENSDPTFALELKNTKSPKDVKKLSLTNDNFSKDWDKIKVEVIIKAVREKFETHSEARDLLLSTDDEELIEANPDDYFWGEGEDGTGKNMMGEILMEIRESFKENYYDKR
ncbi:MAG: NADAR family protein [Nanoarchaeota archaeon]|jgi:ribA/ribD-fused uncharacterized protein|nr:NADAR family protein [Nanoarchaeota archaeon]